MTKNNNRKSRRDDISYLNNIRKKILSLPRFQKRAVIIFNYFICFGGAAWLSTYLVNPDIFLHKTMTLWVHLFYAPVIGIVIFYYSRIYKTVIRFSVDPFNFIKILLSITLVSLIWFSLSWVTMKNIQHNFLMLATFWMFSLFFIWLTRQMAAATLNQESIFYKRKTEDFKPVMIYGAGITGTQLVANIRYNTQYKVIGFIDDNSTLWRQRIHGIKVHPPENLAKMIKNNDVREIFLAVPSSSRKEKREILERLKKFPVEVKTLPNMEDIVSGAVTVNNFKPVSVDDLLGRDPVIARQDLLDKTIRDKTVMVTGAGGSIGSELCRQVLKNGPARLLLLEHSEFALYKIEQELLELQKEAEKTAGKGDNDRKPEIIPLLGSILNEQRLIRTFNKYKINTIFHAAAYKHVPLVEMNPVDGLKNNVTGTYNTARLAAEHKVEHFVLISTDKAVRPTNVMGASKRLSELVLQAMDAEQGSTTRFCMVRFGNVMDSSGSVVRKFREQIINGGPVTVTHRDIVRFFMSIPEAAQLVIQAAAMAKGGDVFVLEMGEPIKILELAKSMIRLMGREWWLAGEKENGDIEIRISGLRPGEKLYEELQIVENTEATEHPLIIRNHEPFLSLHELKEMIKELDTALYMNDIETIRKILGKYVEGYKPSQYPDL